jgi:flavin reductase (DIM6/NTAB) family NADH-FMN oxidoreductase RutF
MRTCKKKDFPPDESRRFLEPGPIVLISSAYRGERNIMTLGWHMMLGFNLVGCYIWDENHSFSLIRGSKECVINVLTFDLEEMKGSLSMTAYSIQRKLPVPFVKKFDHDDRAFTVPAQFTMFF